MGHRPAALMAQRGRPCFGGQHPAPTIQQVCGSELPPHSLKWGLGSSSLRFRSLASSGAVRALAEQVMSALDEG